MRYGLVVCAVAAMLWVVAPAGADVVYQIDNGNFNSGMNCSDGSETRDNWLGNIFTVQAGGETITKVQLYVWSPSVGTIGIYTDNGDATPPRNATLVYQQDYTMTTGSAWNEITLTTPVTLAAGDKMVVGVLIPGTLGSSFPLWSSPDSPSGYSYWDRDFSTALGDPSDYAMAIGDLSNAVGMDQALIPGGWVPAPGCSVVGIRAVGVPEPATMCLLAIGGLAALIRRRKA